MFPWERAGKERACDFFNSREVWECHVWNEFRKINKIFIRGQPSITSFLSIIFLPGPSCINAECNAFFYRPRCYWSVGSDGRTYPSIQSKYISSLGNLAHSNCILALHSWRRFSWTIYRWLVWTLDTFGGDQEDTRRWGNLQLRRKMGSRGSIHLRYRGW